MVTKTDSLSTPPDLPVWPRWVTAGIVVLAIVGGLVFLPVQQWIQSLLEWTRGLGILGYLVVMALYVTACVLFIPGSFVTLAASFLFGLVAGSITVSVGSTLGASAAFLVGRYMARDKIEGKLEGNAKFKAIDEAVGRQGFKMVLLTRLSPIFPFNLPNYAFGLTHVRFGAYVLASWIGMMPGTVLYVYLGSTAKDLTQVFAGGVEGGVGQELFKIVGCLPRLG